MTAAAVQRIVDALRGGGFVVKDSGGGFQAQCPAHDDGNPSLAIRERRNPPAGAVIFCHAGCHYSDVLNALGLTDADLFDDARVVDALGPTRTYVYPGGRKNHRKLGADGKKDFWQEGAGDKSLYGIDLVGDASTVFLCEGEKAADFMVSMNYVAVATGGSQRTCDVAPLAGRVVIIIADRDEAGYRWAARYAELLGSVASAVCITQAKCDIDKADIVEHVAAGYTIAELERVPSVSTNGHKPGLVQLVDDAPKVKIQDIEQGFWERESLNIIYRTALARMCSPWAVLAFCAARVLTQVPPNWTLPALIGGPGSLNWFAAIADASSGGKTTAMSVARLLIGGYVRERQLGSGEGIIGAYYKPAARKDETAEINVANMFVADEVDTVAALNSRTGATTMSTLRQAFSGETLGFSYISKGRDVHIKAHEYRMTLIISVQPGRSSALLDDHHGGTPQRFMWFPANDTRISRESQSFWMPNPIELPDFGNFRQEIAIPGEAEDMILDERVRNARGEVGALDGHALFCREKFAFALSLLDGRTAIDSQDWVLSGVAAEVSAHTRAWVAGGLAAAREREAEEKGRLMGVTYSVSDEEKVYRADERSQRITRWVFNKLEEKGPMSNRELTQAMAGRDRPWLDGALTGLQGAGLIGKDANGSWALLTS